MIESKRSDRLFFGVALVAFAAAAVLVAGPGAAAGAYFMYRRSKASTDAEHDNN